jgi:hypothetical protein
MCFVFVFDVLTVNECLLLCLHDGVMAAGDGSDRMSVHFWFNHKSKIVSKALATNRLKTLFININFKFPFRAHGTTTAHGLSTLSRAEQQRDRRMWMW